MAKKKDETDVAVKDKETTPEGELGNTPEPEPIVQPGPKPVVEGTFTLTQKELDDKISAAGIPLGRKLKDSIEVNAALKRTVDGHTSRVTELETTITSIRTANRERELKDAAGDTTVIDGLTLKHQNEDAALKLSKDRSDFDQVRTQHQADIDDVAKTKATTLAKELADDSGLTADLLLSIGSDTDKDGRTTYNLDRMKDIASKSPKGGEEGEEEVGGEEGVPAKGLRAKARSTGKSAGSLRTFPDFEKAFIAGEISREEYEKAAKRFNIQI